MAWKRDIGDVIDDYNTDDYSDISLLYSYLVDVTGTAYILSEACLNDLFAEEHVIDPTTCNSNYELALNLLTSYNTDLALMSFKLFGYDYEFYLNDCDDNGACVCNNRNINGRNLMSRKVYGVLTDNGYLDNYYSRGYLTQLKYDEMLSKIFISNEHSQVHPPYNTAYLDLDPNIYKNKMILTYLGFDINSAKLLEQIVLDGDHSDTGVWEYELGSTQCYHGNSPECVVIEDDFTNVVLNVDYLDANGQLIFAQYTAPIVQSYPINVVDGKSKLDGIYKTYYFKVPDLVYLFTHDDFTYTFLKDSYYYFEYLNDAGETIVEYCKLKDDIITDYDTGDVEIEFQGITYNYDLTINQDIIDFKTLCFDVISGIDFLKSIGVIRNVINPDNSGLIDTYIGEDTHLVTYNLRDNILNSIQDCNLPCERFSMDTWVALTQKKMAASEMFCRGNLTEAARIMSTVEERCKNCD